MQDTNEIVDSKDSKLCSYTLSNRVHVQKTTRHLPAVYRITAAVITTTFILTGVLPHGVSANGACARVGIEITLSPENASGTDDKGILQVFEHSSTFLPCQYRFREKNQNPDITPFWQINNESIFLEFLPPYHHYNGTGIVISDVTMNLNLWNYICCFDVGDELCESKAVTLHVYQSVHVPDEVTSTTLDSGSPTTNSDAKLQLNVIFMLISSVAVFFAM